MSSLHRRARPRADGNRCSARCLMGRVTATVSGQSSKARELSELQQRIERARGQVGSKRGGERVSSSEIARYSRRLDRLEGKITTLGARRARLQTDLDDRRGELERLPRARLLRLHARLVQTRSALRDRLVEIFKAAKPDIRRQHRELFRCALALRGPRQRCAGRPDGNL